MCHFITLIVPTDDADAVRAVMKRHGRAAEPIDNPSIRRVLHVGEHQYLTTRGHCDCGTVLTPPHDTPETLEATLAKEFARMKRKGWSEAKISRALEDRTKADTRPTRSKRGGSDSLELWNAVLCDLCVELKITYAGLVVRLCSGAIATEAFTASRREVAKGMSWQDALASLENNEVTVFR